MRFNKIILTIVLLMLFSGCAPFMSDVETLIAPPKLTDLQFEIDSSLKQIVGNDIQLRYPQNGDYKSAYNFIDLNDDGVDEAIALFETDNDNIVQLAILSDNNGDWTVVNTLPSESYYNTVDFMSYQEIGDNKFLMIGWSGSNIDNKILVFYNYDSYSSTGQLLSVESRWEYNDLLIDDYNRDGKNEIMLLSRSSEYDSLSSYIQLIQETSPNTINTVSYVELPQVAIDFIGYTSGYIDHEYYGIVVDYLANNDLVYTSAVSVVDNELKMIFIDETGVLGDIYKLTGRHLQVASDDINGDGIIDIPLEEFAVGYENHEDNNNITEDPLYFTNYVNYDNYDFVSLLTSYINLYRGYRFNFPTSWANLPVSAYVQPNGNEVIFFVNETGDIHDHSNELLRINVYSTIDGTDKLDEARYFDIVIKNGYVYSAYIPPETIHEYRLTEEEVISLFTLIN